MKVPDLRGPRETISGMVYVPRLLDKICLHAKGKLPGDYHANLGKGFDAFACNLLKVRYEDLVERVKQGGTDADILDWCFQKGRKPSEEEITMFNDYLAKRGWRDVRSERVADLKKQAGWSNRDEIQTFFDIIDADEERL